MSIIADFPLYRVLTPLAWLYGGVIALRNRLFDWSILPSAHFPLPVICIGNLAVGGTGKTPHVEYLVRLLSGRYRVAVLSRGYKRRTKGFRLADRTDSSETIGDEPFQLKTKFPQLMVAVAEDRRAGIQRLRELPEEQRPQLLLLDDAFQHRYVKPSFAILLTDSHRLYTRDALLPVGRLRESAMGANRADVVVVTKCEPLPTEVERVAIRKELALREGQTLCFSEIRYGDLSPLFPEATQPRTLASLAAEEVLLCTGIAHPEPLERWLRQHTKRLTAMAFPDHHAFSEADAHRIDAVYQQLPSSKKLMIVTEKDAARLRACSFLPSAWRASLYYLPITVGFSAADEQLFNRLIERHIESFSNECKAE